MLIANLLIGISGTRFFYTLHSMAYGCFLLFSLGLFDALFSDRLQQDFVEHGWIKYITACPQDFGRSFIWGGVWGGSFQHYIFSFSFSLYNAEEAVEHQSQNFTLSCLGLLMPVHEFEKKNTQVHHYKYNWHPLCKYSNSHLECFVSIAKTLNQPAVQNAILPQQIYFHLTGEDCAFQYENSGILIFSLGLSK